MRGCARRAWPMRHGRGQGVATAGRQATTRWAAGAHGCEAVAGTHGARARHGERGRAAVPTAKIERGEGMALTGVAGVRGAARLGGAGDGEAGTVQSGMRARRRRR